MFIPDSDRGISDSFRHFFCDCGCGYDTRLGHWHGLLQIFLMTAPCFELTFSSGTGISSCCLLLLCWFPWLARSIRLELVPVSVFPLPSRGMNRSGKKFGRQNQIYSYIPPTSTIKADDDEMVSIRIPNWPLFLHGNRALVWGVQQTG